MQWCRQPLLQLIFFIFTPKYWTKSCGFCTFNSCLHMIHYSCLLLCHSTAPHTSAHWGISKNKGKFKWPVSSLLLEVPHLLSMQKASKWRFNCLFWLHLCFTTCFGSCNSCSRIVFNCVSLLLKCVFCQHSADSDGNQFADNTNSSSFRNITQNSKDALLCVLIPHLYISGCLC